MTARNTGSSISVLGTAFSTTGTIVARSERSVMIQTSTWRTLMALAAGALLSSGCSNHAGSGAAPPPQEADGLGSQGGRLLKDGGVSVEAKIVEDPDMPARLLLYATRDGKPVPPAGMEAEAELKRVDGKVDRLHFTVDKGGLISNEAIGEPHSFDVGIKVRLGAAEHRWTYPQYEGRFHLPKEQADAHGIATEAVGSAVLMPRLSVGGAVVARPGLVAAFNVNRADLDRLRPGLPIDIKSADGRTIGRSHIAAVAPPFAAGSKFTTITATLPAAASDFRLGTPLQGEIHFGVVAVPLAVRTNALQHFRGNKVVLARYGDTYEIRMLKTGLQTQEWTEVVSGISEGTQYITKNVWFLGQKLDRNIVHGH